jgi:hypothetical protein
MADKKISALTASTTPLAGTEVLPIVQGGATVKVSVANLTAGRDATGASFKATTAVGAGTDPGVGLYAVGDYPIGFFTFKRTSVNTAGVAAVGFVASDAKTAGDGVAIAWRALNSADTEKSYATQSARIVTATAGGENSSFVTNVQSSGSSLEMQTIDGNGISTPGNFIVSTSGKGIDFSATSGTGTSELLADYEEGTFTPTWTPATGSGATVNNASGWYTKVGNRVTVDVYISTNGHGTSAGAITIGGLPFTSTANSNQLGGFYLAQAANSGLGIGQMVAGRIIYNTTTFVPIAWGAAGGGTGTMTAAEWGVSGLYRFTGSYQTA